MVDHGTDVLLKTSGAFLEFMFIHFLCKFRDILFGSKKWVTYQLVPVTFQQRPENISHCFRILFAENRKLKLIYQSFLNFITLIKLSFFDSFLNGIDLHFAGTIMRKIISQLWEFVFRVFQLFETLQKSIRDFITRCKRSFQGGLCFFYQFLVLIALVNDWRVPKACKFSWARIRRDRWSWSRFLYLIFVILNGFSFDFRFIQKIS